MGYSYYESSAHEGETIELFKFVRGTEEWRFAKGDASITFDGDLYIATEIHRTAPRQGSDDAPGSIDVFLPSDSALAQVIQQGGNIRTIDLTVYSYHRPNPADTRVIFLGEVTGGDISPSEIKLTCAPLAGQLGQQIPRGTMQRNYCIWTTYDLETCGVDSADFTFDGIVAAISLNGLEITVTGAEDFVPTLPGSVALQDMFVKGVLIKGEQRGEIQHQAGDVVVLSERMPGLAVGNAVSLLAGDSRDPEVCRDKFQNADRMLVHPTMPQVNPFFGQGLGR